MLPYATADAAKIPPLLSTMPSTPEDRAEEEMRTGGGDHRPPPQQAPILPPPQPQHQNQQQFTVIDSVAGGP